MSSQKFLENILAAAQSKFANESVSSSTTTITSLNSNTTPPKHQPASLLQSILSRAQNVADTPARNEIASVKVEQEQSDEEKHQESEQEDQEELDEQDFKPPKEIIISVEKKLATTTTRKRKRPSTESKFALTDEQKAIVFTKLPIQHGYLLKAKAGAGCSKTTVVVNFATEHPNVRLLYIVFNAIMRKEAMSKFKYIENVGVHTYHSLSFAYVLKPLQYRHFLPSKQRPHLTESFKYWMQSEDLFENFPVKHKFKNVSHWLDRQVSKSLWIHTRYILQKFCMSNDLIISNKHASQLKALYKKREEAAETGNYRLLRVLERHTLPEIEDCVTLAKYMMKQIVDRKFIWIDFDISIKLMHVLNVQMRQDFDAFALDEAQDGMPVVCAILKNQKMFRIVVGDPPQAINGFAGAINAMDSMEEDIAAENVQHATLSQTFRFSQELCDFNNKLFQKVKYPQSAPLRSQLSTRTQLLTFATEDYNQLAASLIVDIQNQKFPPSHNKIANAKSNTKKRLKQSEKLPDIEFGILSRTKMGVISFIDAIVTEITSKNLPMRQFRLKSSSTLTKALDEFCAMGHMSDNQLNAKRIEAEDHCQLDVNDVENNARLKMIQFLIAKTDRMQFVKELTFLLHPRKAATMKQDDLKTNCSPCAFHCNVTFEVLTIHQSKGLEWNNVIVLDIEREVKALVEEQLKQVVATGTNDANNDAISFNAKEALFLLYVASTRAKQRFFMPNYFYDWVMLDKIPTFQERC